MAVMGNLLRKYLVYIGTEVNYMEAFGFPVYMTIFIDTLLFKVLL